MVSTVVNTISSIIVYGLIGFMLMLWAAAIVYAGQDLVKRYRYQRARRRR